MTCTYVEKVQHKSPRSPSLQSPVPQFDSGRRLQGMFTKFLALILIKLLGAGLKPILGFRSRPKLALGRLEP